MLSFGLAQELKRAGLVAPTAGAGRYFVNPHIMIRKEEAIRLWYADKAKKDWPFNLEEELVYCPTLSELIEGCGTPFTLSSDQPHRWLAKNVVLGETTTAEGATAIEAVAHLWLILHKKI